MNLRVGAALIVTLAACSAPVERRFSYSTDAASRTGLTLAGEGVLVGNEAGKLTLLSAAGRRVWEVALGREVAARPVAARGLAVAGTVAGELVAVALQDGAERWRVADLPPVVTPLSTDGERVFVLGADGSARAFDLASGTQLWARATLLPRQESATPRLPEPLVSPEHLLLLVATPDLGLLALRTTDGATLWKAALPGALGLAADAQGAYLAAADGRVLAVSLRDGAERWRRELGPGLSAGPFLAHGLVLVGTAPSALVGLAPADGAQTWRTVLPAPLVGAPTSAGGLLLVPTSSRAGHLLGFAPPSAAPVFSVALDSPLRTAPRVLDDTVLVAALDGRVFGLRLKEGKR